MTGKKRKARSDLPELCATLRELDKEAEKRAEERELKRTKLEWEIEERRMEAEEKRREAERKHEERMNYMFMMFAREMMGSRSNHSFPSSFGDTFQPPDFENDSD